MPLKVYKFGGASIATPELARNTVDIIKSLQGYSLVVVISALGKTTNALEEVVQTYYEGDSSRAMELLSQIEKKHIDYVHELLGEDAPEVLLERINGHLTEVEWVLNGPITKSYDYYYDQIVPLGELLSTTIIEVLLHTVTDSIWYDARDLIRTDERYRDARVDWDFSREQTRRALSPQLDSGKVVVTQGFIGSTDQCESTTLGREGSDYSASLLANFLEAEDVTIWKDVPGLLSADPRLEPDAVLIPEISYAEVIEMAYYGAQVIHPKTIRPLYSGKIPMYVRSFLEPESAGTCISVQGVPISELPPITVVKNRQLWVKFTTRDFSFFDERQLSRVYDAFDALGIKQNLTHISAISLDVVIDHKREIITAIEEALEEFFEIDFRQDKKLTTVRHYTDDQLRDSASKDYELQERTPRTISYVESES